MIDISTFPGADIFEGVLYSPSEKYGSQQAHVIETRDFEFDEYYGFLCTWYALGHVLQDSFNRSGSLGPSGLSFLEKVGINSADSIEDANLIAYGSPTDFGFYVKHFALSADNGMYRSKFGNGHVWQHALAAVPDLYGRHTIPLHVGDEWGEPLDSSRYTMVEGGNEKLATLYNGEASWGMMG